MGRMVLKYPNSFHFLNNSNSTIADKIYTPHNVIPDQFHFIFQLIILIYLFLISSTALASEQTGQPYIKYYAIKTIGNTNIGTQFWSICQDNNGIIYLGNSSGIIIYDGVNLQVVKVSNKSTVRSLSYDSEKDIIYVGAQDDIGILKPDSIGNLKFHSLVTHLPPNDRKFGDVWKTHITNEGVVFQTFTKVFVWKNNAMKVFRSKGSMVRSFYINNSLYISNHDQGLITLTKDGLQQLPDGDFFKEKQVYAAMPYDNNSVLITTRNHGLFIYGSDGIRPLKTSFDKLLIDAQIYSGIKVPDNTFLIGTLRNGLFHINKQGELIKNIFETTDIFDRKIYFLKEDQHNGVWAALNNGIAKINYSEPFTYYTNKQGLKGKVRSILRHKGILYIGNSLGLFYMNPKYKKGEKRFNHLPPVSTSTWKLMSLENGLLAGTGSGLYLVKDFKAKLLINQYALPFERSAIDSNKIYIGTLNGVRILNVKDGKFKIGKVIKGTEGQIRGIIETKDKKLWVSVGNRDLLQIDISNGININDPKIAKYNEAHGISTTGRIIPYYTNSGVVFGTQKGYKRFDPKSNSFYPDTILGVTYDEQKDYSYRLRIDPEGNLWRGILNDPVEKGKLGVNGKYQWHHSTFASIPKNEVRDIYFEDNGIIWFGTTNGLIRYDSNINFDIKNSFQTLIRKVSLFTGDSVLLQGYGKNSIKNIASPHEISYDNNSIHFEYAAPFFQNEKSTLYSYKLEGFDNNWSNWSTKTHKEYTFLHEGSYVFKVKAKNVYNVEGNISQFKFIITPPWFRTWWAIVSIIILNIIVIWGGIKLIIWRLENQRNKLAQIVDTRTTEILQQKEELTAQRDKLDEAYQNIKSLSEIGREFTSYLSVEDIIKAVYKNVNTLMDASAFGIGLFNAEYDRLEFSGFIEKQHSLEFHYDNLSDNCLSVWCYKNQKRIFINDRENEYLNYLEADFPSKIGDEASSIIYLPLTIKDHHIGVITVQSFKINAYQPYHINVLENLAIYAAIALENANTYSQLQKSYAKLQKLNNFKDVMTGMIIHDFKNDLNTVINFSQGSPSERRLKSIRQAGRNMLNMALNILDIQKFEDTTVRLSPTIDPVNKVVKEAIDQVVFLLEQKSIEIKCDIDKNYYSNFDYELILRVITNMLTNAIKYTPINGSININGIKKDDFIKLSIIDTGEGIPKDKVHIVFEKYAQIKAKKTGNVRSTGLGLTFCKLVVEAHHGEIGVISEEGSGSNFWFTIPACQKVISDKGDIQEEKQIIEKLNFSFDEAEINLLKPYIDKLQQWDVYCYSEINEILSQIEVEDKDNVARWKNAISSVLLIMNQEKYQELINM